MREGKSGNLVLLIVAMTILT